jgi:hypothetical protein
VVLVAPITTREEEEYVTVLLTSVAARVVAVTFRLALIVAKVLLSNVLRYTVLFAELHIRLEPYGNFVVSVKLNVELKLSVYSALVDIRKFEK